jgi:hypothetical protein
VTGFCECGNDPSDSIAENLLTSLERLCSMESGSWLVSISKRPSSVLTCLFYLNM